MKIGTFLEYKGYVGSIEYSKEDKLYYGSLLGIEDFVNYHCNTVLGLRTQFHNAVDDYILLKKEIEKNNF